MFSARTIARLLVVAQAPVGLASAGDCAECADCATGVHVIVARGTCDGTGMGVMGAIAKGVASRIEGTTMEGLEYPATLLDPYYEYSEKQGAAALEKAIRWYSWACPRSKIAIIGYSQGAQIISEVFCGGSGDRFGDAAPIPHEYVEKSVIAAVLFGDPTRTANSTFNHGTGTGSGVFARSNTTACNGYANRMVSYCDAGDVWCDTGDDDAVHESYLEKYQDEVVNYIVGNYQRFRTTKKRDREL